MKTVIIDDDELIGSSLKTIIEVSGGGEFEVCAVGNSGTQAGELYEKYHPDVMLMDIRMSPVSGLEAGEMLLKTAPDAKILYLTTFSDDEYIIRALNMGAKGYILKQDYERIVPALKAVMNGQSVFGEQIMDRLPGLIGSAAKSGFDYAAAEISSAELDIIKLVAKGMSNKEIASRLFLSEGTVRNYLSDIFIKLGLRDRTQLAVFYYNN